MKPIKLWFKKPKKYLNVFECFLPLGDCNPYTPCAQCQETIDIYNDLYKQGYRIKHIDNKKNRSVNYWIKGKEFCTIMEWKVK